MSLHSLSGLLGVILLIASIAWLLSRRARGTLRRNEWPLFLVAFLVSGGLIAAGIYI